MVASVLASAPYTVVLTLTGHSLHRVSELVGTHEATVSSEIRNFVLCLSVLGIIGLAILCALACFRSRHFRLVYSVQVSYIVVCPFDV